MIVLKSSGLQEAGELLSQKLGSKISSIAPAQGVAFESERPEKLLVFERFKQFAIQLRG